MRVAICGLGTAAQRAHLPALSRAAEAGVARVVGVTDPDPARRRLVAGRCAAQPFADVDTLLEGCAVDLLVIASPPSSHVAAVGAALRRGVDVLCEKPLGVAPGDVEALEELCTAHPRALLAPVHQYRHAAAWEELREAARAALGAGEPALFRIEVERPGTDPLSQGGWRAAGLREGGILGDHAVHYLALLWTVDGAARVDAADLAGEPGRETAHVRVRLGGGLGAATIGVSYAGSRRRNLVELDLPARGQRLRWLDAGLTRCGPGDRRSADPALALSDRQAVNDLYGGMYDELIESAGSPRWRAERVTETLAVARLLDAALGAVR